MVLGKASTEMNQVAKPKVAKKTSQLKVIGESLLNSMDEETLKELGSRSKDIAFISLIVSPFKMVPRRINGQDIEGGLSVGLHLKNVSDTPIEVPSIEQKSSAVMDADYANIKKETVEPGAEFKLTWAESAVFVADNQLNGLLAGDPDKKIRYAPTTPKQIGDLPTTKFILAGGVIAEYAEPISEQTKKDEVRNVLPGFEKFKPFTEIKKAVRKSSPKKGKRASVNTSALAVQKLIAEAAKGQATEA